MANCPKRFQPPLKAQTGTPRIRRALRHARTLRPLNTGRNHTPYQTSTTTGGTPPHVIRGDPLPGRNHLRVNALAEGGAPQLAAPNGRHWPQMGISGSRWAPLAQNGRHCGKRCRGLSPLGPPMLIRPASVMSPMLISSPVVSWIEAVEGVRVRGRVLIR